MIMIDPNESEFLFTIFFEEELEDGFAGLEVEMTYCFVNDEYIRFERECACETGQLLLTVREWAGLFFEQVGEAESFGIGEPARARGDEVEIGADREGGPEHKVLLSDEDRR